MKKLVASVGLVALGASGIQTAYAQALGSPENTKPWSVALTLRGFYDDNPSTLPNDQPNPPGTHRDSFGYEVSPSATLDWAMQQTTINLGVLYAFRYYENIPPLSTDHSDQVFTFNAGLAHTFSERLRGRVNDSFVIGQEPDLLRAGSTYSTFQRVSGDNIRNYGTIALDGQITPTLGIGFGYDNALYDYSAKGVSYTYDPVASGANGIPIYDVVPSLSGTLDRIENRAHLEGLYQIAPETKALLGYQFTDYDYTGDELIGGFSAPFTYPGAVFYPVTSSERNNRQHTVYVGAEHNFLPQMTGSIRAGGSYSDYYNDSSTDASWTPYVNASLKYTYAPESYVQGGIGYDRNATDVVGLVGNGSFTQDAESAVVFAAVNHRLDPRLFASLVAQFQNSYYNGGSFNNDTEQYYVVGLDIEYRFNPFFSAHVGYDYDYLDSNIGRTYDRNRVYIGVTARY